MKSRFARAVLAGAAVGIIAFAVTAAAPGVGSAGMSLHGWASHLTPAQAGVLSANADQRVIVLLRNQHTGLAGRSAARQRAQAFAADRAPIVAQLRQLNAPRVVTYKTVNAVATTVSAAEAANLRSDPAVLAVDPDAIIKGPSTNANLLPDMMRASAAHAATGSSKAAAGSPAVCGTASAPLLEPEALHLIGVDNRTDANSPITSGPKSAHSLGYTGTGVKIAVFPDGMDPNLPDFQRNAHSAITDYRDFTGEGAAPTGGGEAFGDVSSIVSQGQTTYNLDQAINPAFAKAGGTCDVKVLGVAPGADVDVMKVFGATNVGFTSELLQGVDWAIQQDHVDILSMSFGSAPLPNTAAGDPLSAILKNAMSDGIVVVASTGDSSPSNTEGSPALNPGVIGVAASTSYRVLAQTNLYLYYLAQTIHKGSGAPSYELGQSTPGWLDNEVSTLSSSGVTEERRVPDLIAPGDLNWADCSTDTTTYTDCANFTGASDIGLEVFGGTSESTPFTSGVAALVIQAYRESHSGNTPTPAVVRQILFSSATDLGVSAENQGAGLLNGLRAVELAKSYGSHSTTGGLLHSPDNLASLGKPGASFHKTVKVTNSGGSKARITPVLRTLGPAHTLASGKLNLFEAGKGPQGSCAGNTTAQYFEGSTIPELACKTFKVPKGVDLLDSRIGWNPLQNCSGCTAGEPTVREILVDPKGRYGQYSDPAGPRFRLRRRADPPAPRREVDAARLRPGHLELRGQGQLRRDDPDLPHREARGQAGLEGGTARSVGVVQRQGAGPGQARVLDRRGRLPQQPRIEARNDPRRLRGVGARDQEEGRALHRHADRRQRAARGLRAGAQLRVHRAEGRPRPRREREGLAQRLSDDGAAGRSERERRRQPDRLQQGQCCSARTTRMRSSSCGPTRHRGHGG